ncbi:MAG: hypothetical protein JSR60_13020 [Proteobacteria bacterium]|nr:hypothetical protein [Pseudomonadota bacterium]
MKKPMAFLFVILALSSCGKPNAKLNSGTADDTSFVSWPLTQKLNEPGFFLGSELKDVVSKLESRDITKGKFETTPQFDQRALKASLANTYSGFDISKNYVFVTTSKWTYDADHEVLTLEVLFSDYENTDLGTYEASNAFGMKATVQRSISRWINQHFFLPGELPCNCFHGEEQEPLGAHSHQATCSDHEDTSSRTISIKLSPERARHLPEILQIITVESFDTRDLIRDRRAKNLCLIHSRSETTTPKFNDPRDNITTTIDVNARLLRLIVRNDETGETLRDIDYVKTKHTNFDLQVL